jgi:cyclopropane fatty-acyl-phospholipid synthase-like methyltransferase
MRAGRPLRSPEARRVVRELVACQERDPAYNLRQFRSFVGAHQYQRLYELTLRLLPRGSDVLDWGCGNGHFSHFLARLGYRASGFSFKHFPLRSLLDSFSYQFQRGRREEPVALPYPDGAFNAVASVGVLEHVRETGGDERRTLREVRRILKARGLFICHHLPNQHSLANFLASL